MVRLLAADLVGGQAALEGLRALADEIDELRAGIEEGERVAASLPGRERALLINHRLARRILDAHAAWLAEVERELGGGAAD